MKEDIKKNYERPLLQVFELKQTANLLNLSGPGDYGNGGDPFNPGAPFLDDDVIIFEQPY